jgi:hypothetical protein
MRAVSVVRVPFTPACHGTVMKSDRFAVECSDWNTSSHELSSHLVSLKYQSTSPSINDIVGDDLDTMIE